MVEPVTEMERRVDRLRAEVRQAAMTGDRALARVLRGELHRAEAAMAEADRAATDTADHRVRTATDPASVREAVFRALDLLGAPAAPRLVAAVHETLWGADIDGVRLGGLLRAEERAFAAGAARPWYVCAALAADRLATARGLLALSTWPLADRIVGPLSPRVDFLTAAVRVAGHAGRLDPLTPAARRLLWRFAASIPGAAEDVDSMRPAVVARAAEAELAVHREADRAARAAGAAAATRLSAVEQLFGRR